MGEETSDVKASIAVPLEPPAAFDSFAEDLVAGLARRGIRLAPRAGGPVIQEGRTIGQVRAWDRGKGVRIEWHPMGWKPDVVSTIEVRFNPVPGGTRVSVAHLGWIEQVGDVAPELAGWFADMVAGSLLQAMAPKALGDWITDRRARQPTGPEARKTYRDPTFHRPNFKLLLKTLALTRVDRLLEVGCGGGAFLQEALQSGCRAAALDHSREMVQLAREENRGPVQEGRLEVVQAKADRIPYRDGRFTCVATTNVFGFLPDALAALREIHRVLAPSGRLVLFTLSSQLAGTPAAPEPMASRLHFYEDEDLRRLARAAGFAEVDVQRPDLEPFAREAGLAEAEVALFRGAGGSQLLTARHP